MRTDPLRAGVMLAAFVLAGAASAGETESKTASRGKPGGTRVHIAQGMWSHHWKLPEALEDGCEITESFLTSRYGFVTALKGFPAKKEGLLAQRALILANVPVDAFQREGRWDGMRDVPGRSEAWVEEFLAQGGGVFVLGGNYSFGTGGNHKGGVPSGDLSGTRFEAFLPVVTHAGDIAPEKQNKPVALTPLGKHPILEGVDWSGKPVTLFYHEVAPKPGTEVLVKAGEAPVLVVGTYKGGRIVVWTATLHGEPPADKTAYWRWDGWPRLVRNITAWVAAGGSGKDP
jgi:uncharacterized membrane protein